MMSQYIIFGLLLVLLGLGGNTMGLTTNVNAGSLPDGDLVHHPQSHAGHTVGPTAPPSTSHNPFSIPIIENAASEALTLAITATPTSPGLSLTSFTETWIWGLSPSLIPTNVPPLSSATLEWLTTASLSTLNISGTTHTTISITPGKPLVTNTTAPNSAPSSGDGISAQSADANVTVATFTNVEMLSYMSGGAPVATVTNTETVTFAPASIPLTTITPANHSIRTITIGGTPSGLTTSTTCVTLTLSGVGTSTSWVTVSPGTLSGPSTPPTLITLITLTLSSMGTTSTWVTVSPSTLASLSTSTSLITLSMSGVGASTSWVTVSPASGTAAPATATQSPTAGAPSSTTPDQTTTSQASTTTSSSTTAGFRVQNTPEPAQATSTTTTTGPEASHSAAPASGAPGRNPPANFPSLACAVAAGAALLWA